MTFVLAMLGAALAVALELAEACAIVLAVGATRGWRDALLGAGAGALACGVLAGVLGPGLAAGFAGDTLRAVIGTLLILFGMEWLRKGVLRMGGRKSRSSSVDEFNEVEAELSGERQSAGADWAARAVAFKGVLLEGVEIVLIVSVLAAQPQGPAPAIAGAVVAVVITLAAATLLRRPLANVPETELKFLVGVVLTAFGVFFLAEGLNGGWPGGDAGLVYAVGVIAVGALALARSLTPAKAWL